MTGLPMRRSVRAPILALALGLALPLGLSLSEIARADAPKPAVDPENDFGDDIQGNVPGASAIEGRLMAPCCWTQTIDIHDSEISRSMRHEIRRRLLNGESPSVIEASFVERYGQKIMAVQPNSQLKNVFIGLSVVMGGAGVAAVMMLGRWRKQTAASRGKNENTGDGPRDKWDDKLDAELKDLDKE